MFEHSLISRLPLYCPQHRKCPLVYICLDSKCQGWPLFCEECKSSYRHKQRHYGHELNIMDLTRGMEELCGRVDKEKKEVSMIHREMLGVKGVEGLLKWQEQKEQHFNSIENHINTIKFQVEEELNNIIYRFQQELTLQKNKLYAQLEIYYRNYKDKFDRFAKLTEPIVAMHTKFSFYSNPHTLFFKINNEMGQHKLGVWLSELKKTLLHSEKATSIPNQYSEQIRKYGEMANEIMDDLPRIRNVDYERQMPALMSKASFDVLRSLVKVKDQPTSIHRSNSMDAPHQHIPFRHSTSNR